MATGTIKKSKKAKVGGKKKVSKKIDEDVYLPGMALASDEELEVDPSAYVMLHKMNADWPCLSFDNVYVPSLGEEQSAFPMQGVFVTGTQADSRTNNSVYVVHYSNMHRTQHIEGSDDESDESEEENEEILKGAKEPRHNIIGFKHDGGVNRIRTESNSRFVATWSDVGCVYLWDLQDAIASFESSGEKVSSSLDRWDMVRPIHVVNSKVEGYALDWSIKGNFTLLSGDCSGKIHLTEASATGFVTSPEFTGHVGSVEDIQWSPTESTAFASCGVDGTIRLWDTRLPHDRCALTNLAHPGTDVNVISWSRKSDYSLLSGADDGGFMAWDLRNWGSQPTSVLTSKWHRGPITSIEWSPHDAGVLAVAGADDQISIWDMSIKTSSSETNVPLNETFDSIPENLLFIHQGQRDIKELHWNPQFSGVLISTSASGFNVFKTISV